MELKKKLLFIGCFFLGLVSLDGNAFAQRAFVISAIPDQNPEKLNRLYSLLADELSESLSIEVVYKPVINYQAAVSAFRTGDLDLVWFGGLTGVQARLQKPGSVVIAQRDIDAEFHSLFIASSKSQIQPISNINGLKVLKGKRFTFGSESSTSGRLMPQHFLAKAGVSISDFKGGRAGFSGSHDATIVLVQSGSYEVGAVNEEVWKANLSNGQIDLSKVSSIWKTPAYADYHWLAQPNLDEHFGVGFTEKLTNKFLSLNKRSPRQRRILKIFGANSFIRAYDYDYNDIEAIARKLKKIR